MFEQKEFERTELGGWIRRRPGKGSLFVAYDGDRSSTALDYHPDCGWCWLNGSHSEEEHRRAMSRRRGPREQPA